MSRRDHKHRPVRALVSLGLALLSHGVVLTLFFVLGGLHRLPTAPLLSMQDTPRDVTDETDTPLAIESLLSTIDQPQEPTEQEKEQKRQEERKDLRGQVVDIEKPAIEQRPDDARFIAEYDSRVSKETKGPLGDKKAGAPLPPSPPVPPSPAPSPASPPRPLTLRGPIGDKLPSPPSGLAAEQVRELGPDGEFAHRIGEGPLSPNQKPGGAAPPPGALPNLSPSRQLLERTLGLGAGSSDYLEDVDDGDATGLNAKKSKYAAFFNRIKQAVRDEWHPDEILGRHDPSGRIYGTQDRVTTLKVRLRADGRIEDLQVARRSGVDFLDEEAQSAFRRAQPFANPPAGLADADGFIRFNFGFIVNLSGRTSFRFYKYQD